MGYVRAWSFYLALAVSLILLCVSLCLAWPFTSTHWRYRVLCRCWADFVLWSLEKLCHVRYEMRGMENMPDATEHVMVLSKHQSAWDPFWLGKHLAGDVCFLYKRSLNWVPALGWSLKAMDMLAVDRAHGREAFEAFLRDGTKKLQDGWWVTLFPEGTRVAPGERVRYKSGGARVACHAGVPILPIAHNAGRFWGRDSILKRPGTITVVVGPLIETQGKNPVEVTKAVEDWIEAQMAQL